MHAINLSPLLATPFTEHIKHVSFKRFRCKFCSCCFLTIARSFWTRYRSRSFLAFFTRFSNVAGSTGITAAGFRLGKFETDGSNGIFAFYIHFFSICITYILIFAIF